MLVSSIINVLLMFLLIFETYFCIKQKCYNEKSSFNCILIYSKKGNDQIDDIFSGGLCESVGRNTL
ncbi:hypothetical protein HMPREF1214_01524 [Bacteroides sp. HPS0048]|nr:hypothetical protein HMPREF1214_01524 [Bacteroides sp. HPS0048]